MTAVLCKLCDTEYAVTGCQECKTLVCGNCSTMCQTCGVSICSSHTHKTKGGRNLCGKCTAERQARSAALKEKYSNAPKTPAAPGASVPSQPVPPAAGRASAPGISAAAAPSPFGANKGTSFAELAESAPLMPVRETAEEIEKEAGLGPESDDPDMRLDPEEARKKNEGRREAHQSVSGRLELPPMNQNRPILNQSGYQAPSRTKRILAFVFFGIGMLLFYNATPAFKDTLFPFTTGEFRFQQGQMAQIQDTNSLRNTGNIQQFDILAQAPTFFLAWFFLLTYCGGVAILTVGVIRSGISGHLARRNLRAAQNLGKDANTLQ